MSNLHYFTYQNFQVFYDENTNEITFIEKDTRLVFKGYSNKLDIFNDSNYFYRKYAENNKIVLYLVIEIDKIEYLFKQNDC
jgi:hypothetical protein